MIVSKKSHQNLSKYNQFVLKNKIWTYKKEGWFLVKKGKIQVIIYMIMLIRFSERIFMPSRYTGYVYDYAHSFFGKDFIPSRYTAIIFISRCVIFTEETNVTESNISCSLIVDLFPRPFQCTQSNHFQILFN